MNEQTTNPTHFKCQAYVGQTIHDSQSPLINIYIVLYFHVAEKQYPIPH